MIPAYVFCLLISSSWGISEVRFPSWFLFGSATSSYQTEGGWNTSDKTPSVWDDFTHKHPNATKDRSNGDVACDSYHLYEKDIEICAELGLDFYRFSINWPRLLPDGFATNISTDGREYYDNLINGLLKRGVQPMVTLYHWELPKNLQDLGGWANPNMVDWFADYANIVFSLYGDRVKLWVTINEPISVCDNSYVNENFAPDVVEPRVGPYLCTKTLLMAHAKAYRIYSAKYKSLYGGKISFSNNIFYLAPKTEDDKELADLYMEYSHGRYLHPIYSKAGGWSEVLKKFMDTISQKHGYPRSRLPTLSKDEIKFIRGTFDFFALNYYTSRIVRKAKPGEEPVRFYGDMTELPAVFEDFPNGTQGYPVEFTLYPEGIRDVVSWIRRKYGEQDIFITENGFASPNREMEDHDRINYIEMHLKQILLCMYEDGARISGYTYWSLLDNYEWSNGYTAKFGLYDVDFEDKNRKRTPRLSAKYYTDLIRRRTIKMKKKQSVHKL